MVVADDKKFDSSPMRPPTLLLIYPSHSIVHRNS